MIIGKKNTPMDIICIKNAGFTDIVTVGFRYLGYNENQTSVEVANDKGVRSRVPLHYFKEVVSITLEDQVVYCGRFLDLFRRNPDKSIMFLVPQVLGPNVSLLETHPFLINFYRFVKNEQSKGNLIGTDPLDRELFETRMIQFKQALEHVIEAESRPIHGHNFENDED